MVGCCWFDWLWRGTSKKVLSVSDPCELKLERSLPASVPSWPSGTGFGTGRILFGEIVLCRISSLDVVWSSFEGGANNSGVTVYKPNTLPSGYSFLGCYCQTNGEPVEWIIAVAPSSPIDADLEINEAKPAIASPVDYTLLWSSATWSGRQSSPAYFWLPIPPVGYNALGCVVTTSGTKPACQEIVCVCSGLTEESTMDAVLWSTGSTSNPFGIWSTKPSLAGVAGRGISVGSFYSDCSSISATSALPISCLRNVNENLEAMPTLEQAKVLLKAYGPTFFFHPDEKYLPSSVPWFFSQGALLYKKGSNLPDKILRDGSNLPAGGSNDGEYWIDLPNDGTAEEVKKGNLASAVTYVHVKPMLGGTSTELQCWMYYPFNGAATAKISWISLPLGKIGEHVSDWEHFTLRVDNFHGELQQVYFGEHSKGVWLRPHHLEFIDGTNRPVVYASSHGHSAYPHEGVNLQGGTSLGVGIRNDTARSKLSLDASTRYQFLSVEYLKGLITGEGESVPEEPPWLQFMREWGPTIEYDVKAELKKLLAAFPAKVRTSLEDLLDELPDELGGEKGPTGPKEKDVWNGRER